MSGFGAFLAKERHEIFRTWRIWVIPGMLVFFGVTSPLVALVTPKLIGSLAGSQPGVVIQLPDPTGLDGYAQFLKNLSQIVIIAVIIAGAGVVSSERSSGTAILVLTKPLSRAAFVGAKVISFLGLILVPTIIAAIVCVGVSRLVLPPAPVGGFALAVALWLALAALLVGAMTFFSVLLPSRGAAAGAGLALLFVMLLVTIWPPATRYSFAGLLGSVDAALRGHTLQVGWPLITAGLTFGGFVLAAILRFRRQEI